MALEAGARICWAKAGKAKRQSVAAAAAMRDMLRFIRVLRALSLWLARQAPADAQKEKKLRLGC